LNTKVIMQTKRSTSLTLQGSSSFQQKSESNQNMYKKSSKTKSKDKGNDKDKEKGMNKSDNKSTTTNTLITKTKSDLTASNSFNSCNNNNNTIEIIINKTNSLQELQEYISTNDETIILLVKKEVINKESSTKINENCYNTPTPYYDIYFFPGIALDLLRYDNNFDYYIVI